MSPLSDGDRSGITLFAACALVLLAGGLAASLVERVTPVLDPASLRAIGKPTAGCVSILIDVTDPLPPAKQQALKEHVRGLAVEDLRPNQLVTIWRLGRDEGGLERAHALYYPGRTANPLWGNPQRVAARCDSLFWKPMLEYLNDLPKGSTDRSPILESTREISEQPEFSDSRQPHKLLIVSDLLQNSGGLSFYETVPAFEVFRASAAFGKVRANLRGVSVDVLYLSRPGESAAATARLREFWRGYLAACGATSVRLERL